MKTETDCPICGRHFARVHVADQPPLHCSRACANKAPGRITPEIQQRIDATKERTGSTARVAQMYRDSGRFAGARNPAFKGEWLSRPQDSSPRWYVWIDPETKERLGLKRARLARARKVWMDAHPDEPLHSWEPIHHVNGDTLDDRIENLVKMPNNREHARLHDHLGALKRASRQPDIPCEACGAPIRPWKRFCSVACTARGLSGAGNPNFGRPRSAEVRAAIVATKARRRASELVQATAPESHV